MALDALELKRTAAHATGPLAQRIVDLDVTTGSGLAASWSTCEKRHVKPYSKLGATCASSESVCATQRPPSRGSSDTLEMEQLVTRGIACLRAEGTESWQRLNEWVT